MGAMASKSDRVMSISMSEISISNVMPSGISPPMLATMAAIISSFMASAMSMVYWTGSPLSLSILMVTWMSLRLAKASSDMSAPTASVSSPAAAVLLRTSCRNLPSMVPV